MGGRWQDRIRNSTLKEITDVPYVEEIMMREIWRMLGHALRTGLGRIVHGSVNWTPVGTRRVGRPRHTWMRTMRREAGDKRRLVEDIAREREEGRNLIEALCVGWRWMMMMMIV